MRQFDLEHQYKTYLERVGLSEDRMHSQQKVETKRAFMGACGQMLYLLRDDLTKMPEHEGIETLQSMIEQVTQFWITEQNRNN